MIHFILNNSPVSVEKADNNLSMLDWLRCEARKTGTKEGCATGDCGACTIVVGEPANQQDKGSSFNYKSINSCLMPLANAHGKHVVTVESLTPNSNPSLEQLHPVQRAMVECHGSQCGFCTPGIIMSLFAFYLNNQTFPGKKAAIHALGGNLCRCTGYQPIITAAEKSFSYPRVGADFKSAIHALGEMQTQEPIPSLKNNQNVCFVPQSLEQLLTLKLNNPDAKLVAGGTDISIEFSQQLADPQTLISVAQIPELKAWEIDDQTITIGAALPYSDFLDALLEEFPESRELFERLGATQVRNSGTLGGSLGNASPIGDPAPLLIALNASLILSSADDSREVSTEEFFTGYRETVLTNTESITAIKIPRRRENTKLACYKVSKRFEDDISTVCLVTALRFDEQGIVDCRIAAGGMAATPLRAINTEQELIGKALMTNSFAEAVKRIREDFNPLSDVRASAEYRLKSTENLLLRTGHVFTAEIAVASNLHYERIQHAAL